MSEVAVIVLAAGMSRRLGRPKQLLNLAGEPLARHVARKARGSVADRVIAVVGAHAEEVRGAVIDYVDEFVTNEEYAEGQGTSIGAPIGYLDILSGLLGEVNTVVYLLADQPGVETAVIDQVIREWQAGASIVMAKYDDRPGHPVLFDRAYWPELEELSGEQGGRDVIARHPDAVSYVRVSGNAPLDVDTEADWRRLQEWWQVGE